MEQVTAFKLAFSQKLPSLQCGRCHGQLRLYQCVPGTSRISRLSQAVMLGTCVPLEGLVLAQADSGFFLVYSEMHKH